MYIAMIEKELVHKYIIIMNINNNYVKVQNKLDGGLDYVCKLSMPRATDFR